MAQLIFPANPVDGQTYAGDNGVTYTYKSPPGVWTAPSDNKPFTPGSLVIGNWTRVGYDPEGKLYYSWDQQSLRVSGGYYTSMPVYVLISSDARTWTMCKPGPSISTGAGEPGSFAADSFWGSNGSIRCKSYEFSPIGAFSSKAWVFTDLTGIGYTGVKNYTDNSVLCLRPGSNAAGIGPGAVISLNDGGTSSLGTNLDTVLTSPSYTSWGVTQYMVAAQSWLVSPGGGIAMAVSTGNGTSWVKATFSGPDANSVPVSGSSVVAESTNGGLLVWLCRTSNASGDDRGSWVSSNKGLSWTFHPVATTFTTGAWFINGKFRAFSVDGGSVNLWSSTDGVNWTSANVTSLLNGFQPSALERTNSTLVNSTLFLSGTFSQTGQPGISAIPFSFFT